MLTAAQVIMRRWEETPRGYVKPVPAGYPDPYAYWLQRGWAATCCMQVHRSRTKIRAAWGEVRHACYANAIGWASR